MISSDEFVTGMENVEMQAFCSSLGLDSSDAIALFQMLSGNATKHVAMEDFVVGCILLKGEARAFDIYRMREQQAELVKSLRRLEATVVGTIQARGIDSAGSQTVCEFQSLASRGSDPTKIPL